MPTSKPLEIFNDLPFRGKRNRRANDNITGPLNKELPLDEFNGVSSSDERTYVAIQSLANGTSLIGYVAVTIGRIGAGPSWVNSRGETM